MARAKRTDRAEARRRHRQTSAEHAREIEGDEATAESSSASTGAELDYGERRSGDRAGRQAAPAEKTDPNARLGFLAAFRKAYRPANVREDLRLLPQLLTSRGFIIAALLVFLGTALIVIFPGYDGSAFAFELLVWPGSAIGPQLVAGFFAPRASYLLGFVIGLLQGVIFMTLLTTFGPLLGTSVPPDQFSNLLFLGFVSGPFSGMLFAASAAWYRRFLSLTSARRPQAGKSGGRSGPQRRTAQR